MPGEYIALDSSPPMPHAAEDEHEEGCFTAAPVERSSRLVTVAIAICLFCTAVNTILLLAPSAASQVVTIRRLPTTLTREQVATLRRPSHFMGFDDIPRHKPSVPKTLSNYPILLTQVDTADSRKVFQDDPRRFSAAVGTVSPEDRRVLVTETISTIVQFRAIDYGMELCEITIRLPDANSSDALNPAQAFPLSVYRLDSSTPLNVRTLSYNTRPPRISKLGDMTFAHESATKWSQTIPCHREEVLTFELACSELEMESECALVWWQDFGSSQPALVMVQHSTI